MKDISDECCRLTYENDQLKLELVQTKNDGQELERQIIILRDEMTTANEYKEKLKSSSTWLDEMLEIQRHEKDMQGLGFENGESFDSSQSNHQ